MRVLLTGADGFIGSHLAERLVRDGHDVTALVLYNSFDSRGWLDSIPPEVAAAMEIVAGDVRDPGLMHRIVAGRDAVLHLAALIAIPYSYVAPDLYVQTNVQGTLNLLNAARAAGVQRFVHTSTSEVYGTARYVPMDEGHPLQGQSPYSASKIGADQLAYSYYSAFGLPVLVLRPLGPGGDEVGELEEPWRRTAGHHVAVRAALLGPAALTTPQVLTDVVEVEVHGGGVASRRPVLRRSVEDHLHVGAHSRAGPDQLTHHVVHLGDHLVTPE